MSGRNGSDWAFSAEDRRAVYAAIQGRRDIREFDSDPIPESVLARILHAGSCAPSVGFSQPWNFILVRDRTVRAELHSHVEKERIRGSAEFDGERRDKYLALKLEGILSSPVNLCVTCDRERFGPAVLGRNTILDADLFSAVTAVQNIWIAARAEGVGVGWVSILRNSFLSELLDLPGNVVPIAYLCLGYTPEFPRRPVLETKGWLPRVPLSDLVYQDGWGKSPSPSFLKLLGAST